MTQKVIIITGASSGIGKATVNRLIADGHFVVAFARRKERLQQLAEHWGDKIMVVAGDVTQVKDVERLMMETLDRHGRIDVLINNAGVGMLGPMENASLKDWHAMMDVNVKGVLNCIHTAIPSLMQTHGHIFNIASVAAHDVFPNAVVYCASKHALNAITVGFRKEFRDRIKITNISPGAVQTEFSSHTHDENFKQHFDKNFEGIVIKPEDIANAISHIMNLPDHLVVNEYIIRPNK
jgi:NADP-dependent 3-hydroxy acid dehydrogenase YdfG